MSITQIRGDTQIIDGSITNAEISPTASIALSKLAEDVLQADGGQALTNNWSVGSFRISTSYSGSFSDSDYVTKGYVDGVAQGLTVKDPVRVASTAHMTGTYYNGPSNDGVGATLTNSGAQAALSIDGVAVEVGDRVLLKDQTDAAVAEVGSVQTVADSSGSLNNKYFWIFTGMGSGSNYYVWLNVNAGGSDPAPGLPAHRTGAATGVEVAIATDATADAVATALRAAIGAIGGSSVFTTGGSTNTVTITHQTAGLADDIQDGNTTGFTITTTTEGRDLGYPNGIYDVTNVGSGSTNWVLTRSAEFDNTPVGEVIAGSFFFVTQGSTNASKGFVQSNRGGWNGTAYAIVMGEHKLTFSQFSEAGTQGAGLGLVVNGADLDVNVGDGIEIVSDAVAINLDGTSNGTSGLKLTATGLAVSDNIDGTGLTLTSGVLSVNASQTQITAVGTLTTGTWNAATIGQQYGGTGLNTSSVTNGQLLIGNSTGNVFALGSITGVTDEITASYSSPNVQIGISPNYDGGTAITTLGTIGTGTWQGTTIGVAYGGTGQTTYTNGQLLIGNTTGNTLTKATLTATADRIAITNGTGSIQIDIASTYAGQATITTVGTITSGTWQGTTIAVDQGGTGQTTYANGELLIGNSTGNTLAKSTLTAGSGITITNAEGSITIAVASSYAGGSSIVTVGTITTGTWNGTAIGEAYGGTGETTYTDGQLLIGNTAGGLTKATLTDGSVVATNGNGSITLNVSSSYAGGSSIATVGTITTGTWNGTAIAANYGGTGLTSITDGAVMVGSGTGAVTPITIAEGQVLIGQTSGDPVSAALTGGNGIAVSSASGSITLNVDFSIGETPTGTINGVNDTFTLAASPVAGSEMIFVNGQLMTRNTDYTISTNTIVFAGSAIPVTNDILRAAYLK